MICIPTHGSLILENPLLTAIRINKTHLTHSANEITTPSDYTIAETCSRLRATQEGLPGISPQIDKLFDGIDTDYYKEPDAEAKTEQLNSTKPNPAPQNTIYVRIIKQIATKSPCFETADLSLFDPRNAYITVTLEKCWETFMKSG